MNLITVTDVAITELRRIATEENKPYKVRVALKGGGCSGHTVDMHFTKFPADEEFDLTFDPGGIDFIVDVKSALYIQGATLNYQQNGLLNRGFVWSFPNSTGGCGCGTSFAF